MSNSRKEALAALERADAETRERLMAADAEVAEARAALEEAENKRSAEILRASEEGWTLQRIGDVLGLSRQRIAQLRGEQ